MQAYQQTFIQILTAAIKGEVYAPPEAVPAEEWEQIIRCAQEHEVLPLVFEACHREEGLKELPICGAVRQQAVRDVFTQTRKTGEFLALYRALRKAGVTPLVVKGIVTGIFSKTNGSSGNGVYIQDMKNEGGYYVYGLKDGKDPEADLGLKVGMTVEVAGTKASFEPKLDYVVANNQIGELAQKLYDELTGIQWGKRPDERGWCYKVKI